MSYPEPRCLLPSCLVAHLSSDTGRLAFLKLTDSNLLLLCAVASHRMLRAWWRYLLGRGNSEEA